MTCYIDRIAGVNPAEYDFDASKLLVRDQANQFRLYQNHATFAKEYSAMPAELRQFHEVILGDYPRKVYFDLEISAEKMNRATYYASLRRIIEATMASIDESHGFGPMLEDFIVLSSHSAKKWSNHVIVRNFALPNCTQLAEFVTGIIGRIGSEAATIVDTGVYKSIQSMRMCMSHKAGREMIFDAEFPTQCDVLDTFVTNVRTAHVLNVALTTSKLSVSKRAKLADVQAAVLEIVASAGVAEAFTFRSANDTGVFAFDRMKPSMCEFCNRVHENDSTLFVTLSDAGSVFVHCRKCPGESRKIGEIPTAKSKSKVSVGAYLDGVISRETARKRKSAYPNDGAYNEPTMRPYELEPRTLVVQGHMGIGKTKELRNYITAVAGEIEATGRPCRIIAVTARANISEKTFHDLEDLGFEHYKGTDGKLTADRLIIQAESLWRVDTFGMRWPDLLVIDECESFFSQLTSGLGVNPGLSNETFYSLMRLSERCVLLDAVVTSRTARIAARFRPKTVAFYHENSHTIAADRTHYLTLQREDWLAKLGEYMGQDKKIAIASSSLTCAESVFQLLSERYTKARCHIYSSKTPVREKREHFADVNAAWANFDVVIFTPTVSAAISFELHRFDALFAFFTDLSCPVETCMQMLGRIRNLADKSTYIHVSAEGFNVPVTTAGILEKMVARRTRATVELNGAQSLQTRVLDNGGIIYADTDYLFVYLENMRVINLSRRAFLERLVSLLAFTGATVKRLELTGDETAITLEEYKNASADFALKSAETIANASEIDAETFAEISTRISTGEDVSQEELVSHAKKMLRRQYSYEGPIDKQFVIERSPRDAIRVFANRKKIASAGSVQQFLDGLRQDDANFDAQFALHGAALSRRETHHTFAYDTHARAIEIAALLGWPDLKPKDLPFIELYANIEANRAKLCENIAQLEDITLVKMPRKATRESILNASKKIIAKMYGYSIRPSREIYRLIDTFVPL